MKILLAELTRMWRSKLLWICTAGAFLANFALAGFMNYERDNGLIGCFRYSVFAAGIFTALFVGTEYSENTIRNKLAVGAGRTGIYLAELFTVTIGGLVIAAAGECAAYLRNRVLDDGIIIDTRAYLLGLVACAGAIFAASAFFTMMGMLITKRSSGLVWSLFISLLVMFGAMLLSSRLAEPKMAVISQLQEDGTYAPMKLRENPYYIGGAKRVILGFVNNATAFGAIERARELETLPELPYLPLYSLGSGAFVTAIGAAKFRKKDLK